jgi:integrase
LERAGLTIPNPFEKIKPYPAGDHRYQGGIDAEKIFSTALVELQDKPEVLKAFLLCMCAGLRRAEADKLEWPAFLWDQNIVRIAPTAWLHIKGKKAGDVALEPEIMGLFRGWHAQAKSSFVLESHIKARVLTPYAHYRCPHTFDALITWLHAQGLTSRSPVHQLRKEFGSRIYLHFDLLAASHALRHSSVAVTAGHYLTKRPGVTAGFGSLVSESAKVIPLPAFAGTDENQLPTTSTSA